MKGHDHVPISQYSSSHGRKVSFTYWHSTRRKRFNTVQEYSLAMGRKLASHIGTPLGEKDSTQYKSIVRAPQYLTLTRLDIAFAVNKICQILHAPINAYWAVVKRILRYLNGCTKLDLKIVNNLLLVSVFLDGRLS
jgi:hypothetical protein